MQPTPKAGPRTVSLVVAIVMLIVGAAVGAGIAYVGVSTITASANLCSSGRTLTIGALYDRSGELSNQGNRASLSSQIAISDINAFLAGAGCTVKFAININDYGLDNARAQTAIESFNAAGVKVVIGPLNSGTAQFILQYANDHNIVLISPSSTSPALAINDDSLFRTVPNDAAQGFADAKILRDRGAEAVVIVNRKDTYGDGLASATAARFQALGGFVQSTITYDTTTTDFTATLTQMAADYTAADNVPAYRNKVALFLITFEEIRSLIIQADAQQRQLLSTPLPWFGTDGQAQNTVIVSNATSGPLLAQVVLPSTLYATSNNTKTVSLIERFVAQNPGEICDSYCLGAYDDVWLAAQATLQAGSYDGAKIQSVLPTVAENSFGVTGWLGLEPSGDRIPTSYQIWKVVDQGGGTITWVLAGTWDKATDTITWVSVP